MQEYHISRFAHFDRKLEENTFAYAAFYIFEFLTTLHSLLERYGYESN